MWILSVSKKADILKQGEKAYMYGGNTGKMIYSNQMFEDDTFSTTPEYFLAEERFSSGHDDTAGFVEIIDIDGKYLI